MDFKKIIQAVLNFIYRSIPVPIKDPKPTPMPPEPTPTPPSVPEPVIPKVDPRLKLYELAKSCLGKDIAATQDELGCAEAISYLLKQVQVKKFPKGGYLSTTDLHSFLKKSDQFTQVPLSKNLPGDIIISPTGMSTKGAAHGHVGIMGYHGIMSNNSLNGLWQQYYSLESWSNYYGVKLGFPILVFRYAPPLS